MTACPDGSFLRFQNLTALGMLIFLDTEFTSLEYAHLTNGIAADLSYRVGASDGLDGVGERRA